MSNAYIQAAEACRREVTRLKGLSEAADVLEKIGSLEQAHAETVKRTEEATAQATEAQTRLAALTLGIAEVEAKAKAIVDSAHAQAKACIAEAEEKAVAHTTKTQTAANKVLTEAFNEAKRLRDAGNAEYQSAMRLKTDVDKRREQSQAQLDVLKREFAEYQDKMAQAKAAAKAMLG